MYSSRIKALLLPKEKRVIARLNTPKKIQSFLDTLAINFEEDGETVMSPRTLLKKKKGHCIEAALFAAATLAYHNQLPLLLDFQTLPSDEDHVVTLFKKNGYWGAISKTNHAVLKWRDPVYKTVRELAMSYYNEYYLWNGKKSMLAFSKPFDLRKYDPRRWLATEDDLQWLAEDLDASKHFPAVPKKSLKETRNASPIEIKAMRLVEWKKANKLL